MPPIKSIIVNELSGVYCLHLLAYTYIQKSFLGMFLWSKKKKKDVSTLLAWEDFEVETGDEWMIAKWRKKKLNWESWNLASKHKKNHKTNSTCFVSAKRFWGNRKHLESQSVMTERFRGEVCISAKRSHVCYTVDGTQKEHDGLPVSLPMVNSLELIVPWYSPPGYCVVRNISKYEQKDKTKQ